MKYNPYGNKGGMGGGMNMQQLQQQAMKMQQEMAAAQAEVAAAQLSATSGGGMITVSMTGDKKLTGIKIDPRAVDPDDVEMLEDLLIAAYNEAYSKAEALYEEKMGRFGGLV